MTDRRAAILYRMVLPNHTCPYGIRAKQMLEEAGYEVEDCLLRSRDEVDAFQDANGVASTPQILIGEDWVKGSDELERYLIKEQSIG
jgi:glutaredoxin 3